MLPITMWSVLFVSVGKTWPGEGSEKNGGSGRKRQPGIVLVYTSQATAAVRSVLRLALDNAACWFAGMMRGVGFHDRRLCAFLALHNDEWTTETLFCDVKV